MTQDEIIETAREAGGQVTAWVNHSTIQKTTTFTFESPLDYYVSGEFPEKYHIKFLEAFANLVAAKEREALAQTQEPVAHLWECIGRWSAYLVSNGKQANCAPPSWLVDAVNNATTPPQRTWVDLTDDEYFALQMKIKTPMISVQDYIDAMRMVEAKLKEKNT